MMAYGRYQPSSSPWASGAPPMYGSSHTHTHTHPQHAHNVHNAHNAHTHTHVAHVPPPQYPQTSYGHSSPNAWNPTPAPQMRQTGWSPQNTFTHTMHHIQHNQQRGGIRPMVGPTGKRVNMGIGWDAPPNKKFAKSNRGGSGSGSGGGVGVGGAMSGQNYWRSQTHKFHNQRQNRDKRNNRELNRVKQQNDNQKERRQQHDMAQKAAESLDKKEYSIDHTANKQDSDANKSLEIDSAQEKYVLAVFGYVCQICNVFVKDKSARYEHCQSEEHLTKFNSVEEEAKKETEKKPETIKSIPEDTVANTNESKSELTDTVENVNGDTNVKNENKNEEAIVKTNETNENTSVADETITKVNEKIEKEENKDNEDTDEDNDALKPNDESGGKALSRDEVSQPLQSCNDNVNPNPTDVNKALDANPQSNNNFNTGDYSIANRGRGSFSRGRAHQGRGGSPRGRGRNRGRGRK